MQFEFQLEVFVVLNRVKGTDHVYLAVSAPGAYQRACIEPKLARFISREYPSDS